MAFADFLAALRHEDAEGQIHLIMHRFFHAAQSHVFAEAPANAEGLLKERVGTALFERTFVRFHPRQIVLCGSAHLGFSPVPDPERFGKPFSSVTSDMDFAIISPELFDRWWQELRGADLRGRQFRDVAHDLLYGFINPANVREVTDIGRDWWRMFGALRTPYARAIRGRLYRDYFAMEGYHQMAVEKGLRLVRTGQLPGEWA